MCLSDREGEKVIFGKTGRNGWEKRGILAADILIFLEHRFTQIEQIFCLVSYFKLGYMLRDVLRHRSQAFN